jgi:hypothetical protein
MKASNAGWLVLVAAIFLAGISFQRGRCPEEAQTFDTDPHWEWLSKSSWCRTRCRLCVSTSVTAQRIIAGGKRAGEIGGWVQRSITPAWYAKAIRPKDLPE